MDPSELAHLARMAALCERWAVYLGWSVQGESLKVIRGDDARSGSPVETGAAHLANDRHPVVAGSDGVEAGRLMRCPAETADVHPDGIGTVVHATGTGSPTTGRHCEGT